MTRRRRHGSALFDVVIALVLLALSGVAMLTVVGQTRHSMRSVRDTERELRLASAQLDRFVAYDRAQVIAMLGTRSTNGWMIAVARVSDGLFDVSVTRVGASVPLLVTTIYRPDTTRAPP